VGREDNGPVAALCFRQQKKKAKEDENNNKKEVKHKCASTLEARAHTHDPENNNNNLKAKQTTKQKDVARSFRRFLAALRGVTVNAVRPRSARPATDGPLAERFLLGCGRFE
jgi:hypothetical protein